MIAPNAEQIEEAVDGLSKVSGFIRDSQNKELRSGLGAARCEKLGIQFPVSVEFASGYALGLQTAREVIAGSAALALAKVNPAEVL